MGWSRHRRPGSCGFHSLMIAMDARARRPIILDPIGPHPARPRRPAPTRRSAPPAGPPPPDAPAAPPGPGEAPPLRASLATMGDPRRPSGRRHPLVAILAMAAAAVL